MRVPAGSRLDAADPQRPPLDTIRRGTDSVSAYVGCIGRAVPKEEYLESLKAAGFRDVGIAEESSFPVACFSTDPLAKAVVGNLSVAPGGVGELEGRLAG